MAVSAVFAVFEQEGLKLFRHPFRTGPAQMRLIDEDLASAVRPLKIAMQVADTFEFTGFAGHRLTEQDHDIAGFNGRLKQVA